MEGRRQARGVGRERGCLSTQPSYRRIYCSAGPPTLLCELWSAGLQRHLLLTLGLIKTRPGWPRRAAVTWVFGHRGSCSRAFMPLLTRGSQISRSIVSMRESEESSTGDRCCDRPGHYSHDRSEQYSVPHSSLNLPHFRPTQPILFHTAHELYHRCAGRVFYVCARPDGPKPHGRCDHFAWASERSVRGSAAAPRGPQNKKTRR